MNVLLIDTHRDDTRSIVIQPPDEHRDIEVPITETRVVVVGHNVDPKPGEKPYVAFWSFANDEAGRDAHRNAHTRAYGDISPKERLLAVIFDSPGLEPQLPLELVNLDGIRVIRVDLDPHVPKHVVIIPERHLL